MALRVNGESFEKDVLGFEGVVLADFYSDSCIPCKRMSPLLAEIEEEDPDIRLAKININFDGELAEKYQVQAAPTIIFFKNGEEAERLRGAVKKSEITEIINKLK
ncbi:MAG: thioredoxin family protein [Huintestinicola sp.]